MSKAGYSRVTHPSAANPFHLHPEGFCRNFIARLACVKRAASVRPEPGSNSQFNVCLKLAFQLTFAFFILTELLFGLYFSQSIYFI